MRLKYIIMVLLVCVSFAHADLTPHDDWNFRDIYSILNALDINSSKFCLGGFCITDWININGTNYDDSGINATQSSDNTSIWSFTNTLASDAIKNETERVNDNTTQEGQITTLQSNAVLNSTDLEIQKVDGVLNSTELLALQADSILNETQRVEDNQTLTNMIFDDTAINFTQSSDNASIWSFFNTLASDAIKNETKSDDDNATQENLLEELNISIAELNTSLMLNSSALVALQVDSVLNSSELLALQSDVILNWTQIFNDNTTQETAISELNTTQGTQQLLNGTDMNFLNVGIGTTTPTSNLHVASDGRIDGDLILGGDVLHINVTAINVNESITLSDTSQVVQILLNASGISYINGGNVGIGTTSPNSLLQINGTTNSLLNITNGTDDFVTVLNTGNVGIGTGGPNAKLELYGSTDADHKLRITDTRSGNDGLTGINIGQIEFFTKDNDWVGGAGNVSASIAVVSQDQWANEQAMVFRTGAGAGLHNTEKMRIDSNGNVGIGTTEPDYLLSIGSAAPIIALEREGSNIYGSSISTASNAGVEWLRFGAGSGEAITTNKMVIGSNGYVGIGEELPGAKLSVSGGLAIGSTYDTTAVTDGNVIISGNIGIGTTTPTHKLNVIGAGNFTGNLTGVKLRGELFNYTANASAWTFPIDAEDIYYNVTNLTDRILNGFTSTHTDQSNGGSYLTAQVTGTYDITASISFETISNNQLFAFVVVKNWDINTGRHCYSRRFVSNLARVGSVSISCSLDLISGDTISVQVENEGSASDITFHAINLKAVN